MCELVDLRVRDPVRARGLGASRWLRALERALERVHKLTTGSQAYYSARPRLLCAECASQSRVRMGHASAHTGRNQRLETAFLVQFGAVVGVSCT
eukprot:1886328-Rhodomonas_salina.2